jgi:outer membrane biosynthesis protein TonB
MIKTIVTFAILFLGFHLVTAQEKDDPSKSISLVSDVMPKVISLPKPEFPQGGINVKGTVSVIVTIDEEGNVIKGNAVSGHPLLRPFAERAAMKAKFEPFSLGEKPIKIRFPIVYNFVPEIAFPFEENEAQAKIKTSISLGILNNKATFLPQPIYPREVLQPRSKGDIYVQIIFNLQKGNVVSATAVSGNELFKKYVEETALKAKFQPLKIEGSPLFGTGILVYKHPSESIQTNDLDNNKRLPVIVRDIAVNNRAKYLPKPVFPKSCRCSGVVKVRIVVDMNGDVIDASTDSGHPLLRVSAAEAASQTKFAPTLINQGPIYVVAYLEYDFRTNGKVKM